MISSAAIEDVNGNRQAADCKPVVLSADDIHKGFFGNPVLKAVSIAVRAGSIHALLGENGAGKSTLINILSGGLKPDLGTITIGGKAYSSLTPPMAQRLGIAVVHQELSLSPHLSVAENVAYGHMPRRRGLLDYNAIARDVGAIFADLELDLETRDADRSAASGDAAAPGDRQGALSQAAASDPR